MAAKPELPPRSRPPRAWRLSPAQALRHCRGLIDTVTNSCEGERNSVLLWAACRAAEDGLLTEEGDQIWEALVDAAEASGLDHDEIHRVLCGAIAIAGREDWA
jgi:hypothetical protein